MSFAEQIQGYIKKYDGLTTKVFQGSCYQVSKDIAEGSPVSTGRLLGSWSPSNGSASSYHFAGGEPAWKKEGGRFTKDDSIAAQNKTTALANVKARLAGTTSALNKNETYHFTNDTPYITQAEHTGWEQTGAYHMRENAILNWQLIVDTVVNRLNK